MGTSGNSTRTCTLAEKRDGAKRFRLVDGTGSVRIRLANFEAIVEEDHHREGGLGPFYERERALVDGARRALEEQVASLEGLAAAGARAALSISEDHAARRELTFRECVLRPGEEVAVRGIFRRRRVKGKKGTRGVVEAPPDGKLIITDDPELVLEARLERS